MERIPNEAPRQKLMNGHHDKQTYVSEHADWDDQLEYEAGGMAERCFSCQPNLIGIRNVRPG